MIAGDLFTAFPLRPHRNDATSRKLRERYQRFAEKQLSKYERVLIVMGNHEHYREIFQDTAGLIHGFLAEYAPNARLLDNETELLPNGVAVIGTTLWAPSCVGTADEYRLVNAMNDFSVIRTIAPASSSLSGFNGPRTFRPRDAYDEHQNAKAFLAEEVPRHNRVIVLSHHAPTLHSSSGHLHGTPWMDDAYCANLVDFIMSHPQIEVWAHGHTHHDVSYRVGATHVVANHRGYFPHERISHHFDPSARDFEIKE